MPSFGALSLLPPLLAIVAAVATRRALLALFCGVWVGAAVFTGGFGLATAIGWIVDAVTEPFNAKILIFTFLLGAGVAFIWRLGGSEALLRAAVERIGSRRQAGVIAWLLGMLVFFNDYANTAIVGSSMRDVTDEFDISREKLSYIVDSTAAPVSTFAISDWIVYQISMITQGYEAAGIADRAPGAFGVFLGSIPYNFYCLLAVLMVGIVVLTGRDYGEMLAAETRAVATGNVLRDGATPLQSVEGNLGDPRTDRPMLKSFFAPIVALVVVTVAGAWWTGRNAAGGVSGGPFRAALEIAGNASWVTALIWGALAMVAVGAVIGVGYGILSLDETMDTVVDGFTVMMTANVLLTLAWSLGTVVEKLGTGEYVTSAVGGFVTPTNLFVLVALSAAVIAFAIGSSWGTMAIVTPVAITLAWETGGAAALAPTVGAVFSGAIFGDHSSPISDTTVLSATFTGSDLIDHVRTQFYYAATVMGVALLLFLGAGATGLSPWLFVAAGVLALIALVYALSEYDSRRRSVAARPDSSASAGDD